MFTKYFINLSNDEKNSILNYAKNLWEWSKEDYSDIHISSKLDAIDMAIKDYKCS